MDELDARNSLITMSWALENEKLPNIVNIHMMHFFISNLKSMRILIIAIFPCLFQFFRFEILNDLRIDPVDITVPDDNIGPGKKEVSAIVGKIGIGIGIFVGECCKFGRRPLTVFNFLYYIDNRMPDLGEKKKTLINSVLHSWYRVNRLIKSRSRIWPLLPAEPASRGRVDHRDALPSYTNKRDIIPNIIYIPLKMSFILRRFLLH